jgi:transposase-like protein
MYRGSLHFLISILARLGLKKRWHACNVTCPNCSGNHVELLNQTIDKDGSWKREEYLCCDCDSQWDWTYERPFFRWRVKIRPPRWVRID